jgi:hypothetical protein
MDLPALRERLKYIATQAKASGGWNKMFLDARKQVEKAIKAKTAEVQAASKPAEEPLVAGPFDERGAANKMMLRFAESTGVPHEVVEAEGKFRIQPIQEASDAGNGNAVPSGDDGIGSAGPAAGDGAVDGAGTVPAGSVRADEPVAGQPDRNGRQGDAEVPADAGGTTDAKPALTADAPAVVEQPQRKGQARRDADRAKHKRQEEAVRQAQENIARRQAEKEAAAIASSPEEVPEMAPSEPEQATGGPVFTRDEIAVAKPKTSRRKQPNGSVSGEVTTTVDAPGKITSPENWSRLGDVDATKALVSARLGEDGKAPSRKDAVWTVRGKKGVVIARGLTYADAVERAKDHVMGANAVPKQPAAEEVEAQRQTAEPVVEKSDEDAANDEMPAGAVAHMPPPDDAERPGGKGPAHETEATGDELAQFAESVIENPNEARSVRYGEVGEQTAEAFKQAGLDVAGFVHVVDSATVNHIMKQHGNPEKEAARGQIAVTPKDFARLPDVVSNPDKVEPVGKTKRGLEAVRYTKRINGHIVVVEAARTGRHRLAVVTMWKTRPGADARPEAVPPPTSETLRAGSSKDNVASTQEDANPDTQAKAGNKVAEAGEELTYNRRNRIRTGLKWSDVEGMNDALKAKGTVKAKVWPKPDYDALIASGMQPLVAHIVKQVYDSVSAKPQTVRAPADADFKRYIEAMGRLQDGVMAWANDSQAVAAWLSKIGSRASRMLGAMQGQPVALAELGGAPAKDLLQSVYPEGWRNYQDELRVVGGNKVLRALQPSTDEAVKALKEIEKGWPGKREAWQVQGYQVLPKSAHEVQSSGFGKFNLRLGGRFVAQFDTSEQAEAAMNEAAPFTLVDKYGRAQGTFDTEAAAIEAARERVKREGKDGPVEEGMNVADVERTGTDRRAGEDVTAQRLMDDFGFRGVNFGRWVPDNERQLHLNHAFDSFHDLAEILGVPPQAMSLNGMLGIAFGAQGGGKALAHFVPGVNEINITRTNGAGSLAHEWGHAIDHYFATQAGLSTTENPFLTAHATLPGRMDRFVMKDGKHVRETVDRFAGVRPEIVDAFKRIVDTMEKRQESREEMENRLARAKEGAVKRVDQWLAAIRRDFKGHEERFDAIAARIKAGELGEGMVRAGKSYLSPTVNELRDLYKSITGRTYSLDQVNGLQSNIDHWQFVTDDTRASRKHEPQRVSTEYARKAAEMDKNKGGKGYWATPWEMFARAFDAYVSDKLEAQAAKNTYLSHAGRNDQTTPTGDERTVIGQAFADLIAGIEVREEGGRPVMYSATDAGAIEQLMADKSGSATVTREGIGEITIEYGDKDAGLAHIAARRGASFMERLPDLLATGEVYRKDNQPDRIFIGNERDEAVIRTDRDGAKENWLLSAYEKHPEAKQSRSADEKVDEPYVRLSDKELKDALTIGTAAGSVIARLIENGVIVIHRSARTLPSEVKVKSGVQAVTMPDGTMHLVAGQLTKKNARAVLLHEMFHSGVRPLIGSAQWSELMGRMGSLYRQAEQSNGKAREFFDRARERVGKAKAKGAVPIRMEVEEFAAYAIEEYERAPDSLPAAIRKWVEDLIGMIKAYLLGSWGKQIGQVTPAQLSGLAKFALASMEAKRRGFPVPEEVYSLDDERTVEVDGVRRPIRDSEGNLIAGGDFMKQIAFWRDYAGQVDEAGRPVLTEPSYSVADDTPVDEIAQHIDRRPLSLAVEGGLASLKKFGILPMVPMNYLVDYARPNMTAAGEYMRVKRAMDTYRGDKHGEYDAHAQRWLKFNGKNKAHAQALADLMHESTIAQVDPSAPYSPDLSEAEKVILKRQPKSEAAARIREKIEAEPARKEAYDGLAERFNALPEEGKALYRDTRDLYTKQAKELDKIILENVERTLKAATDKARDKYERDVDQAKAEMKGAELDKELKRLHADYTKEVGLAKYRNRARLAALRQVFEANRLAGPYFPLARFGEYFVAVRDENGDMVSFNKFEKLAEARKFEQDAKKNRKHEVKLGVMSNRDEVRGAVDPKFLADIEGILEKSGVPSDVQDEVWQRYLNTMPDLSMRKRFIHRKGTAGYSSDALRAFASNMFHGSHQMARLKFSPELTEALDTMRKQGEESDKPVDAGLLVNEFEQRHQWVMNPQGNALAQGLSSMAFVWNLAMTPAAAIINTSQTFMLGVPVLGSRLGGQGRALVELAKASKELATSKKWTVENNPRLNAKEKEALHEFYRLGLIDRTQAHDLAGVGETGVEYSPVKAKVMKTISFMYHHAERINREVTALAAYRMARRQGQGHEQALETAAEATWATHFDYSNSNRPRYLQGNWQKALLIHRQHSINMTYRLFRDMHDAFKGESDQVRKEARAQFVGIMAMHGLMAGIKGLPFYGIAMIAAGMLSGLGDDDDKLTPEDRLKKTLYEHLPKWLADTLIYGAPSVGSGLSVTSRIGFPDLWFRSPDKELEGKEEGLYYLEQFAGAGFGMGMKIAAGVNLIRDGHFERGMEKLLPKAIGDLLKANRYRREGALTMTGNPVVDQFSTWEVLGQAAGFTPHKVTQQYDVNNARMRLQTAIQSERSQLFNKAYLAFKVEDSEAYDEAVEKITQFADKHPEAGIKGSTVSQYIRNRMKNDARSKGGLILNKKMESAIDEDLGLMEDEQ